MLHRYTEAETESYYDGAITLPLFYRLTESDQDRIVGQLRSSLGCD